MVQRRLDLLAAEGITFCPGVNIGADLPAEQLREESDALLLCLGATWPRNLNIPGRDSAGIHFAMEFLHTWQQRQHGDSVAPISASGLDVLVIGGGDTGCDCIGTALRQGAKSITSFEILPTPPTNRGKDNPWPQWPRTFKAAKTNIGNQMCESRVQNKSSFYAFELLQICKNLTLLLLPSSGHTDVTCWLQVDYGHEEVKVKWGGDPRRYNTLSKRFTTDQDRVTGVDTVLVSSAAADLSISG